MQRQNPAVSTSIIRFEYYSVAPCNLDFVRRLHEVANAPTDVLPGGFIDWHPVWVGTNRRRESLKGEVGVLMDVVPSKTEEANRFFLVIEDERLRRLLFVSGSVFLSPNLQAIRFTGNT